NGVLRRDDHRVGKLVRGRELLPGVKARRRRKPVLVTDLVALERPRVGHRDDPGAIGMVAEPRGVRPASPAGTDHGHGRARSRRFGWFAGRRIGWLTHLTSPHSGASSRPILVGSVHGALLTSREAGPSLA